MTKTKQNYVEYLNECAPDIDSEEWIIGGKRRHGNYGKAIQKYDPILFEIGFREWKELESDCLQGDRRSGGAKR
jgi:hypothetical protein